MKPKHQIGEEMLFDNILYKVKRIMVLNDRYLFLMTNDNNIDDEFWYFDEEDTENNGESK